MKLQRLFTLFLVVVISIAFIGCAGTQKKVVHDQAIADQIKAQMESAAGPEGPFVVDIMVTKGAVTLDGQVKSYQAKEKSMEIAQQVEGVKDVKSFILVK
jgi:osmotically-inducible protein OsmY